MWRWCGLPPPSQANRGKLQPQMALGAWVTGCPSLRLLHDQGTGCRLPAVATWRVAGMLQLTVSKESRAQAPPALAAMPQTLALSSSVPPAAAPCGLLALVAERTNHPSANSAAAGSAWGPCVVKDGTMPMQVAPKPHSMQVGTSTDLSTNTSVSRVKDCTLRARRLAGSFNSVSRCVVKLWPPTLSLTGSLAGVAMVQGCAPRCKACGSLPGARMSPHALATSAA